MAVSRSVLRRRFRAAPGRTIHELIAGLRLRHVKQLLVETDLTLPSIADRAGFSHVEYLCTAFRKATALPPGPSGTARAVSEWGPDETRLIKMKESAVAEECESPRRAPARLR